MCTRKVPYTTARSTAHPSSSPLDIIIDLLLSQHHTLFFLEPDKSPLPFTITSYCCGTCGLRSSGPLFWSVFGTAANLTR